MSDGYQQGIEWSRMTSGSEYSITKPALTTNVPSAVTPYVIKYSSLNPLNLLATVELLRAFGTVKVLSSPKLAVLNNQTATLKVSEDFVYFNVKQDVVPGPNTNATVTTTTTPQSVSIGFFMSLTAQISDNGTVTLNVRPSISSIAELKQDPNPALAANNIKNLVPQIRMREIESMMRVESGDIAVLGGLMEDRLDNRDRAPAGPRRYPVYRRSVQYPQQLVVEDRAGRSDAPDGDQGRLDRWRLQQLQRRPAGQGFLQDRSGLPAVLAPRAPPGAAAVSLLMDALRRAEEAKRKASAERRPDGHGGAGRTAPRPPGAGNATRAINYHRSPGACR
jgi:hypothetical protein